MQPLATKALHTRRASPSVVVNRSARAACKDAAYERRVALFLTKNELTRPSQLKKAEHPREWFGAFEFNDEELEAIRNLQEVPQSLSGPASAALLHQLPQIMQC